MATTMRLQITHPAILIITCPDIVMRLSLFKILNNQFVVSVFIRL